MEMMAASNAAAILNDLKARTSGLAVALVSRDGSVLRAEMPPGTYVETFAIMCATLFGAAATASRELDRASPVRVVIEGSDATTLVATCGPSNLLVVVVAAGTDPSSAAREVERFAAVLSTA